MFARWIPALLLLGLLFVSQPARARNPAARVKVRVWQAQTVSVPAGLYTLDELAAKLSTSDVPVKAAPGVARRLGFAGLKAHTQSEVLHVLETAFALKVRPRPAPEKGFVLDEDPEVAQREHRWMNRFVALVQARIMDEIDDTVNLMEMSQEARIRERDKRSKEQQAQYARAGTKNGTPSGHAYMDLSMGYTRAMMAAQNPKLFGAALPYVGTRPELLSLVNETVRRGQYLRGEAVPATSEPDKGSNAFVITHALFEHHWHDYDLKILVDDYSADRKNEYKMGEVFDGHLVDVLFGSAKPSGKAGGDGFAPALGRDAAAWIKTERAQTNAFLATQPAWTEFKINPALPSDAMSSRVWQWCIALDKEAVVEVYPNVDASEANAQSLSHIFQRYDYWSACEVNGVAVFTNRLAFLDRARPWNGAALQYLVQAQAKAAIEKSGAAVGFTMPNATAFPFSLLARFTERMWENKSYIAWDYPGVATSRNSYYQCEPRDLDNAAVIGWLWKNRPKSLPELPSRRTEIALSAFDAATVQQLAQWFEATGTSAARHPNFEQSLRQSGHFVLEPSQDRKRLKASVVFADPKTPLTPEALPRLTIALDQ